MYVYCSFGDSSFPFLYQTTDGNGLPSTEHFNSNLSPCPTSIARSNFLMNAGGDLSSAKRNLASVAPTIFVATAAYYTYTKKKKKY